MLGYETHNDPCLRRDLKPSVVLSSESTFVPGVSRNRLKYSFYSCTGCFLIYTRMSPREGGP